MADAHALDLSPGSNIMVDDEMLSGYQPPVRQQPLLCRSCVSCIVADAHSRPGLRGPRTAVYLCRERREMVFSTLNGKVAILFHHAQMRTQFIYAPIPIARSYLLTWSDGARCSSQRLGRAGRGAQNLVTRSSRGEVIPRDPHARKKRICFLCLQLGNTEKTKRRPIP